MAGLLLHLKLELVVSSCEKFASGELATVTECANDLHKKVSCFCFLECYFML